MAAVKKEAPKPIPDALKAEFSRLIAADRIMKLAEERKKAESEVIKKELLKAFAEHLWDKHAPPKHNPRYGVYDDAGRLDASGIYQVKKQFSFQLSERQNADELGVAYCLEADLVETVGMTQEKAHTLVEAELHAYPSLPITLDSLLYGHYEEGEWQDATEIEQAAGKKLLAFVMADTKEDMPELLTELERNCIREREREVWRLRPGFFERLYQYCENAEQLYKVLLLLNPTNYFSHCNLGSALTPEGRVRRYSQAAEELVKDSKLG